MPRTLDEKTERHLAELLDEQAQVVSRQQALEIGMRDATIKARLRSRRWQNGYPGTYVAHNGEVSYLSRVWSAVLYAGDGAMASHETASYLHCLVDKAPDEVHVTIPSTRRVARQSGLVVHLSKRSQEQILSSPPRTTVEETTLDLAASKAKPDDVAGVLTNACQRRKTVPPRLIAALAVRKKMPHRRLVEDVLRAIAQGVESVLEWRYLRDVEQPHGLPRAGRQIARRRQGKCEYVDVQYKEYRVIIELDGEVFHAGERRSRDKVRDNAAAARDEFTLRYGWTEVTRTPCEVAAQVAAVLRNRGWQGTLRRCHRCRTAP